MKCRTALHSKAVPAAAWLPLRYRRQLHEWGDGGMGGPEARTTDHDTATHLLDQQVIPELLRTTLLQLEPLEKALSLLPLHRLRVCNNGTGMIDICGGPALLSTERGDGNGFPYRTGIAENSGDALASARAPFHGCIGEHPRPGIHTHTFSSSNDARCASARSRRLLHGSRLGASILVFFL